MLSSHLVTAVLPPVRPRVSLLISASSLTCLRDASSPSCLVHTGHKGSLCWSAWRNRIWKEQSSVELHGKWSRRCSCSLHLAQGGGSFLWFALSVLRRDAPRGQSPTVTVRVAWTDLCPETLLLWDRGTPSPMSADAAQQLLIPSRATDHLQPPVLSCSDPSLSQMMPRKAVSKPNLQVVRTVVPQDCDLGWVSRNGSHSKCCKVVLPPLPPHAHLLFHGGSGPVCGGPSCQHPPPTTCEMKLKVHYPSAPWRY